MRNVIIKYLSGQPIDINEAAWVIDEYMKQNNKVNPNFIQNMINHPASQMLLDRAVSISVEFLIVNYNITKLFSKEGNLIKVY